MAEAWDCRTSGSVCKPCMVPPPGSRSPVSKVVAAGPRWNFLLGNKAMQTFLADDEAAARLRLRRLLDRYPQVKIIGEATNGIEAVEAIERLPPELLFLDIQ